MEELIKLARKVAYDEVEKTGMPLKQHIDLSVEKAKKLAKMLNVNVEVVEIGTLIMDCLIGTAIKEGNINKHIEMSLVKTNELLNGTNLDEKTKENIRHCVLEHHGAEKFYSIESEICCNADCYRFVSVEGVTIAIRYLREMPFNELINLVENKFNEKCKLLSLDICKKELNEQIETIEKYIEFLKSINI